MERGDNVVGSGQVVVPEHAMPPAQAVQPAQAALLLQQLLLHLLPSLPPEAVGGGGQRTPCASYFDN